jgi:hypothetical protein
MRTQLWIATFVPENIPEWVNPLITIDYDRTGKQFFVFEIDPDDQIFTRCKTPDAKAMRLLKVFGFKKPQKIYQGLASEMFLKLDDYPPCLSRLSVLKL